MLAACAAILVSMGLRQTFGLFFSAFEEGLNCTRTEFGLAIGIQMLFWGLFAPIFGLLADKFGGSKSVFIGFVIFCSVSLTFLPVSNLLFNNIFFFPKYRWFKF